MPDAESAPSQKSARLWLLTGSEYNLYRRKIKNNHNLYRRKIKKYSRQIFLAY